MLDKNYLYYGDNLDVLRRKIATESVDLCYIDPPFNSKRNYFQIYNNQGSEDRAQSQAFMDTWEWGVEAITAFAYITNIENLQNRKFTNQTVELIRGLHKVLGEGDLFAYLVHMTLRIVEIHRVLKSTGSFYLHCDPTASHYLKLILDSVFCGQGGDFQNEIAWHYGQRTGFHKQHFSRKHDIVFFYSKSTNSIFNEVSETWSKAKFLANRHDVMTDENGIEFIWADGGKKGVRYKRLVSEVLAAGKPLDSVWDIPILNSSAKERLGYPTQKPEALLERIIKASSNEGDIVLDAYCGCGTTLAVAQRLKRRWIGIDITYQSISLILKRLQDKYPDPDQWAIIEANIQLDGVPRDIESAVALANRKDDKTRKEFEKWAVLFYSNNHARISNKKGADAGIDGIAYFLVDKNTNGKAVFQVKSGGASRATIATLNSDRQREKAEFGILITMDEPTKAMKQEVYAAGKYKHPMLNREDDRIQIVTIAEILNGKRIDLPMGRTDTLKSAEEEDDGRQTSLI